MDLYICTHVYIPLRAAPSHRTEMVSQILFGERFSIIESSGTWVRIETLFDTYTGWIDSAQYGYTGWNEEFPGIITSRELICIRDDGSQMTLAPGSELLNLSDDLSTFTVSGTEYRLTEPHASRLAPHASPLTPHTSLSETGMQFLNTPYLWGGRTHMGIDCSGLVQIVFKIHGTALPRDASQQAQNGITVDFISDARPGDVLFFSSDTDTISHTGILLAKETIIHAAGRVRRDRVDHQGIWSDEAGRYTHRLRLIKRML